jgi:hypothetical protein
MTHDADEKMFKHESYGMVGFSRVTGSSGRLFGSSLPSQGTFIRLRVLRAERTHHLGRDWFQGNPTPVVELDLSANQFAELLTSMNVGSGVPCTLRSVEGRVLAPCPEEKPEAEQIRSDFKEKLSEVARNMEESRTRVGAILEKKALSQADKVEIRRLLGLLIQEVSSNIPFWLNQFHEATGKIISSAKAEIDSFMTHAIVKAGIHALGGSDPPITAPAMLTGGRTDADADEGAE